MISRSDGESYHLLLADTPRPYPAERGNQEMWGVSVCFWHAHIVSPTETRTTIVLLPERTLGWSELVFRQVETVADLLANKLSRSGNLNSWYDLRSRPTRASDQLVA